MTIKNEYLIIVDKESSPGFFSLCDSTKRFNEFLVKNSSIVVAGNKITFKGADYSYRLKKGKVKGKEQLFYYATIGHADVDDALDGFRKLLREFKSVLQADTAIVETLRDDLSFYYSQQAYSLIHKVENMMRKFITYFMITNVGKDWVEESSPEQIKTVLSKSKRKQYLDVLQQLDFVHLGDFLFKSYQEGSNSKLYEKISSLVDEKDINLSELQRFVPKSNWDKYFKEKVNCDDSYLKSRWLKLYDLRNIVAHTSHLSESDFEDIKLLVTEVSTMLEEAFKNIDSIDLAEVDKETISENIAINIDENIGMYLREWNSLEEQLRLLAPECGENAPVLDVLDCLKVNEAIEVEALDKINNLRVIRNKLVHSTDSSESENILNYNKQLIALSDDIKSSWKNEVIMALEALGGVARLEDIYRYIEQHTRRILTPSWMSTVRKAIYLHSSDTEIFSNKEDLFERMEKGKWRLRQ